jgi:hypothetical protein
MNWAKVEIPDHHRGIRLGTARIAACNEPDHTMRYFRITRDGSAWALEVVTPLHSRYLRLPTLTKATDFAESYVPAYDEFDYRDLAALGVDVRGYGPGWMRFSRPWHQMAREARHARVDAG